MKNPDKRGKMSMATQKKYDREFKLNAVKLYREGGKSLEKLGADLGIPMTTLHGSKNSKNRVKKAFLDLDL